MDLVANNFFPFMYGSLVGTGLFAIYVEFAPGLGSVIIRPNSNNEPTINLNSLFNLMKAPLTNSNLWKKDNLDINYIFVVMTCGLSGVIIRRLANCL